jgi:hypothetical protein
VGGTCLLEYLVDGVVIGKREMHARCTPSCFRRTVERPRAVGFERPRFFRRAVPNLYLFAAAAHGADEVRPEKAGSQKCDHVSLLRI